MKTTLLKQVFFCSYFLFSIYNLSGQGSGKSLFVNGSNEYVKINHNSSLNLTSAFTMELWVNPDAIPSGWAALVSKGVSDRPPSIWLYYNSIELWYGSGTDGLIAYSDYGTISNGVWQHVAVTRSSSGTVKIYINGKLESTVSGTSTPPSNSKNLALGQRGDGSYYYDGGMDDVRIWNIERSQAEIQASMCMKLNGTETGLIAYYNLDEGSGSTAIDAAGSLNGTLKRTPTYATSAVPIGDESISLFPGSWSGQRLSITSPEGDSMVISDVTGNPDGIILYRVDELPNAINGISNYGSNSHYFGVFKANGSSPTYTMTYHYSGNDWYEPRKNDNNLVIFMRNDNSGTSWTEPVQTLDLGDKTLSLTGTNSEYMLGDDGSPFPVELLDFFGKENSGQIDLFWSTATELNTNYFLLERSTSNTRWESLVEIPASGNSQQIRNYSFSDLEPVSGTSFYRLSSFDLDGKSESFPIVEMHTIQNEEVSLQARPNPADEDLFLYSSANIDVSLVDFQGRILLELYLEAGETQVEISHLAEGIYYLRYETSENKSKTMKVFIK